MHGMLILSVLLPGLALPGAQKFDPELEAEVKTRISTVEAWAADPVIVGAVRDANESPRSMTEIELIDTEWQKTTGVDDFMRTIINNTAADRLRELRSESPELQEAFVTDELGANVASTNKTSDFYQGDEAKFHDAYNDGAGAVHTGQISRDESIQSYSMQIGVPVMDEGRAIGVLVVTVNVEKLKRMMDSR